MTLLNWTNCLSNTNLILTRKHVVLKYVFLTGIVFLEAIIACWHYISKSGVYTDKEISIHHSTSFKYVAVYKYQTVLEILTLGKRNNMNKRYINELLYGIHLSLCVSTGACVVNNMLGMYLNGILGTGIASIFLNLHKRMWCIWCSCGTVTLMVLGQFSDICGL